MNRYADIIASLEAATGPDREIDAEICVALGYVCHAGTGVVTNIRAADDGEAPDPEDLYYAVDGVDDCIERTPCLTGSLDAVIALVERMLPGAEFELTTIYNIAQATLPLNGPDYFHGRSETGSLPIAMLIAMFRALEAEAKP